MRAVNERENKMALWLKRHPTNPFRILQTQDQEIIINFLCNSTTTCGKAEEDSRESIQLEIQGQYPILFPQRVYIKVTRLSRAYRTALSPFRAL